MICSVIEAANWHTEPAALAGATQLQATAHPSCWHIAVVLKHPLLNLIHSVLTPPLHFL
jgi:hypothetical protein